MRYAVVGDPVSHSLSPTMHMAGFRSLGIDATYGLIETPVDRFASIVSKLRNGSLDGVNVTMPHKHNAFMAADVVGASVARLAAANTIVSIDGELRGYNTDIDGVQHALSTIALAPDAPVHVLGAGGAAGAAILASDGARPLSIASRTPERASNLLERLRVDATVYPWEAGPEGAIIVNATPIGMHEEHLPFGIVESSIGLIDMAYGDATTPSVQKAVKIGVPYADGIVMLAGQAAKAFEIFTGIIVPVEVLERAARGRSPFDTTFS